MPKKRSTKRWVEILDTLWRLCIFVRDDGVCQYTKWALKIDMPGTDAHHIFSRSNKLTRWDVGNGVLLKAYHNYGPAHKDPETFRKFLIDRLGGESELQKLYDKAHTSFKPKEADYSAIGEQLCWYLGFYLSRRPKWWKAKVSRILRNEVPKDYYESVKYFMEMEA